MAALPRVPGGQRLWLPRRGLPPFEVREVSTAVTIWAAWATDQKQWVLLFGDEKTTTLVMKIVHFCGAKRGPETRRRWRLLVPFC